MLFIHGMHRDMGSAHCAAGVGLVEGTKEKEEGMKVTIDLAFIVLLLCACLFLLLGSLVATLIFFRSVLDKYTIYKTPNKINSIKESMKECKDSEITINAQSVSIFVKDNYHAEGKETWSKCDNGHSSDFGSDKILTTHKDERYTKDNDNNGGSSDENS